MASAPILTVAVAMYQAEGTIGRVLESVLPQAGSGVEVLIVDDGSTDRSVAIVKAFQTDGVRLSLLRNRTNQGSGPTRNKAIAKAKGQYIMFVDSDDEVMDGALPAIASRVAGSGLDILVIGAVEQKRGRDIPLNNPEAIAKLSKNSDSCTIEDQPELLLFSPSPWSKVFRRDFIERHQIEFPSGYHQDLPWSLEALLRAERIGVLDYICYRYIRRGEGSSATRSKGTKTLVRVDQIRRIRERTEISSLPLNVQEHLVASVAMHLIWGNRAAYRTLPEELHEELFTRSATELKWWLEVARPGSSVRSEPLMPTREREKFTRSLVRGDFSAWQRAMAAHTRELRWRRRFSPSRYRLFKR